MPLGEFAEISVLETLDLTDNYVGELSHVKQLSKFAKLTTLAFQKAGDQSKGSNPICDFVNYKDTVQMYLPYLSVLDGFHMQQEEGQQQQRQARTPAAGALKYGPLGSDSSGLNAQQKMGYAATQQN